MSTFNYAARDYDTIKSDLLARARRVMPDWTDRDPSDFGMMLVDLWATMGDVTHYYADRAATEAFLETATQRTSVLSMANLLDYKPVGRASATGTVTVDNTTVSDYLVTKDTEFSARHNDKTYYMVTKDDTTVSAESSQAIMVYEGKLVEEEVLTTSSTGLPGQKYSLSDPGGAAATLRIDVYEDGVTAVPYTPVPRLSTAVAGQRVFATHLGADGNIEVDFGNDFYGYVPPAGSTITATYVSCSGVEGNLPAGVVTGLTLSSTGVNVSTNSALSGGADEESIQSMKTSIPSVLSTQDRAVTSNDFIAMATAIPGVSKASLSYSAGTATLYLQESRSDYLTTGDSSQTVDTDLRTLVEETVQDRALLGVTVATSATVDWKEIDITGTVYVNERAITNSVQTAVVTALDELFAFDNVHFGQLLHLGQIHRIVLNVPGVDYVDVTKFALSTGGVSQVDNSILIDPLELPKKGTYALTFSGGISVS